MNDDTEMTEEEWAEAWEEEAHARLMAGLLGIDLNDRYPTGDENGIIGTAGGAGFLSWTHPDDRQE